MNQSRAARKIEESYGCIFGLRPFELISDQKDQIELYQTYDNNTKISFEGIINIYMNKYAGAIAAPSIIEFFTILQDRINSGTFKRQLLSYHNGFEDSGCKYHGHHWHWLVDLYTPPNDTRWVRRLHALARDTENRCVYFASERAKVACALARHLKKPPRIPIVEIGTYESVKPDPLITPMDEKQAENPLHPPITTKLSKNPNYHRIEWLVELMRKYRTVNQVTLKAHVVRNAEEWSSFRELQASAAFDSQWKKAEDIFRTEACQIPFTILLDDQNAEMERLYGEDNLKTTDILTVQTSVHLLEDWLEFQFGTKKNEFIDNLYSVLNKVEPKRNTFIIQGPPNCGKTYFLRAILPWFMYFGEVRTMINNNFPFQDCIQCGIIYIDEFQLTQENIEQMKVIMEGQDTIVNQKCKGGAMLHRTPIIGTTNTTPWYWVTGEREAIMSRMYYWRAKQFERLKDVRGKLNPLAWKIVFNKRLFLKDYENSETQQQDWVIPDELQEIAEELLLEESVSFETVMTQDGANKMPETPRRPYDPITPTAPRKRRRLEFKKEDNEPAPICILPDDDKENNDDIISISSDDDDILITAAQWAETIDQE